MPKFKSVIAGLAISTAMTGAVVSLGALTTASTADATTASAVTSTANGFVSNDHHRNRQKLRIWIHNNNHQSQHQKLYQDQDQDQDQDQFDSPNGLLSSLLAGDDED